MFGANDQGLAASDDPAMLDNVQSTTTATSQSTGMFQHASDNFSSSQAAQRTPTFGPALTTQTHHEAATIVEPAPGFSSMPSDDFQNSEISDHPPGTSEELSSMVGSHDNTYSQNGFPTHDAENGPSPTVSAVANGTASGLHDTPAGMGNLSIPADDATHNDMSFTPPSGPPALDDDMPPTSAIDHQKLADMKQAALKHLEPLVDHINQSPEEEFRTTMMMIQANDNHTLLEKAFAAAQRITDDKARATALLDIINEINYFAQADQ